MLASDPAEIVVQRIRITTRQVGGRRDPQLAQIGGDSRADVRDVFETSKLLPPLRYISFYVRLPFVSFHQAAEIPP